MSSTNKTTNYELSQFVSSDKPAWLTDYNQDMSKIDAGIDTAQDTATSASGKADANTLSIGDLTSLTTTAKTNLVAAVNEVKSDAGTAQNTATQASQDASAAGTAASNAMTAIEKLNLSVFKEYKPSDMSASGCTMQGTTTAFTLARDTSGSVFKLYGTLNVTGTQTGNCTVTLSNTGVVPTNEFTIVGCGIYTQNGSYAITSPSIKVKTNGTMEVSTYVNNTQTGVIRLMACLYFAKDFGDQPQE